MTNTDEFNRAVQQNLDAWVPGCGGIEKPFRARSGKRLLWCYNPGQNRHAYIDVDSDMELTDEEAHTHMGMV